MNTPILGLIVGLILLFLVLGFRRIPAPRLQKYRIWFPSWRLFESVGHTYWVFISQDGQKTWHPLEPHLQRQWWNLFINPQGNLWLAFRSQLEILISKNLSPKEMEQDSLYLSIRKFIAENGSLNTGKAWSFKICTRLQSSSSSWEDILVSPIYEDKVL